MRQKFRNIRSSSLVQSRKVQILVVVLVFGGFGLFMMRYGNAATSPPTLSDTPYVKLFTQADSGAKQANNPTTVAQLKQWYTHVHSEASNQFPFGEASKNSSTDTTLAKKLADAGVWSSNYRNGSYVSQANSDQVNFGEAADIEKTAPLAIGTFWAGNYAPYAAGTDSATAAKLTAALTAGTTTVQLGEVTSKPTGTAATWPFINSKDPDGSSDGNDIFNGGYSQSTAEYVSWVRIDNEILQVVAEPTVANGVVTLTVKRGAFGTTPTSHVSGVKVMAPTYIGSTQAVTSDAALAGSPNVNSATKGLRYSIKIWSPEGYGWIAKRTKATFGGEGLGGYNTVWLDVSSCNQYNNGASSGHEVWNWDDPNGKKMTRDQWGVYQKVKADGLRSLLPGVKFTGNNLGSNFEQCYETLLSSVYDGGVFEHWMKSDPAWNLNWSASMGQNIKVQNGNWPGIYWVRWNYDFYAGNQTAAQIAGYKRFSYGSLLLALNPAANKYQYGGAWGFSKPDEMYFYNLGTPANQPTSLTDITVTNGVYSRQFTGGLVLVNPGTTSQTYNLTQEFYDVGGGIDASPDAAPKLVSGTVTIGPKDGMILAKPTATNTGDTTAPVKITGVTSSDITETSLKLTWSQSSDNVGIVNYVVMRNGITIATVSSPSYSDTGLSADTAYTYTVIATDAAGNKSVPSDALNVKTAAPAIDNIPSVSVSSPSSGSTVQGTVSVQATAQDDKGIKEVQLLVNGVLSKTDTSAPYAFDWDSTSVANGTHSLRIRAVDTASQTSDASLSVTTSNGDTQAPAAVKNLAASPNAYDKVNLTWSTPTDNTGVTGYWLVRDNVTIAKLAAQNNYVDTSLNPSTSYKYSIYAFDAAQNVSAISNLAVTQTPQKPDTISPSAPTGLSAKVISSSQINLTWTLSTDNVGVTGYDVYRNNTKIAFVTSPSFGDGSLSASTSYSYYIVARDAAGNSSGKSVSVSSTTLSRSKTGGFGGKVRNASGYIVAGASVTVYAGSAKQTVVTNSYGDYVINGLTTKTWKYGTFAPTYKDYYGYVKVSAGTTIQHNITLQKR